MKSIILGKKGAINTVDVGRYGERVAEYHLKSKGHEILARNLRLKKGEIDILTLKSGNIYIIEVKAMCMPVSRSSTKRSKQNTHQIPNDNPNIPIRDNQDNFLPEDNLSKAKIRKLYRLRRELAYLLEIGFGLDPHILNKINVRVDPVGTYLTRDIYIEGIAVYVYCAKGGESGDPSVEYVSCIKVRSFPFL
jgi:hypothetical protein